MSPLLSSDTLEVVIPVRNGGDPLRASLGSLRESQDQNFRVTISDNHSTDGCPWKSSLGDFPKDQVTLIQPPQPLGRVEHWTWAAQQARATYCKLLLCGDRLPPDHLGAIRQAFSHQPDLIYTPYIILGRGNTMEEELAELDLRPGLTPLSAEAYRQRNPSIMNLIGPPSAVTFRTASLQAALPFDPTHPWTADWRLYTRVMERGSAICCDSVYCIQDRTIARLSSSFQGALKGIFEERAYQRELLGLPPVEGLSRYLTAWRPVLGLVSRHYLPRPMSRALSRGAGSLTGRRRRPA